MFVRCKKRFKDGKVHRYWSVVENVRVGGGRLDAPRDATGHSRQTGPVLKLMPAAQAHELREAHAPYE